jgi:lipoprotein-anchoring transpeptidase ErfK/SrfK
MEESIPVARFRNSGSRSLVLFLIVGVVAAGAWGAYAWRFRHSHQPGAGSGPPSGADVGSTDPTAATPGGATTLRAIHPLPEPPPQPPVPGAPEPETAAQGASPNAGAPSSLITANAPPSANQGIGFVIGAPASASPAAASHDVQAARAAIDGGDLITGRALLSKALAASPPPTDAEYARGEVRRIAEVMLFSRATLPDDLLAGVHVLAGGESLNAIAKRYAMTEELLARINEIADPNRVRSGQRLKVLHGPFNAVISKADHLMNVYLGEVVVRSFRVGLGTNGGTPTGVWMVRDKLRNPDWTDPITAHHYAADDPTNPIGEHWIALTCLEGECVGRQGFGIHGTVDPASIGQNQSMGCVRMLPDEVAFVFDLLVPNQSRVVIK